MSEIKTNNLIPEIKKRKPSNAKMHAYCFAVAKVIDRKMHDFFDDDEEPLILVQVTTPVNSGDNYYGIIIRFKEDCDHAAALDWVWKELKKYPELYYRVTSYDDDRFLVRKDFPGVEKLKKPKKAKESVVTDVSTST